MTTTEKKLNPKFTQEIRKGDKEIDEIKAIIDFCTMSTELKATCIEYAREAMRTTTENNTNYYKTLAKKIKLNLEAEKVENWNVIVGTDFGSWVAFDKAHMLFFRLDEIYFLIFRFGSES